MGKKARIRSFMINIKRKIKHLYLQYVRNRGYTNAAYKAYKDNIFWKNTIKNRYPLFKKISNYITSTLKEGMMLDIGTGPGDFLLILSSQQSGIKCTGIDIDEHLIKHAKSSAKKSKRNGLDYLKANASALPFPDNYFDRITSFMSIYQWDEREKGLSEAFRVLKPGGEIIILVGRDWFYPGHYILHVLDFFQHKSRNLLINLVKSAGFSHLEVKYIGLFNLIIMLTAQKFTKDG